MTRLGAKYPWALGKPASTVWSEIWDDIGPRVEAVTESGVSTWDEHLLLFLERSGYPEETYHTFSYSPLAADDGTVAGLLCVVSEDTEEVIAHRRMQTLRDLGERSVGSNTVAETVAAACGKLQAAARWTCPSRWSTSTRTTAGLPGWSARTGFTTDHPAAPAVSRARTPCGRCPTPGPPRSSSRSDSRACRPAAGTRHPRGPPSSRSRRATSRRTASSSPA